MHVPNSTRAAMTIAVFATFLVVVAGALSVILSSQFEAQAHPHHCHRGPCHSPTRTTTPPTTTNAPQTTMPTTKPTTTMLATTDPTTTQPTTTQPTTTTPVATRPTTARPAVPPDVGSAPPAPQIVGSGGGDEPSDSGSSGQREAEDRAPIARPLTQVQSPPQAPDPTPAEDDGSVDGPVGAAGPTEPGVGPTSEPAPEVVLAAAVDVWHPAVVAAGLTTLLGAGAGAGVMTYRGASAQRARVNAARAEFFGPTSGGR